VKKRFGETAFVLKAVFAFVFVRLGRRRARHDSFLSFLLLEGQVSGIMLFSATVQPKMK